MKINKIDKGNGVVTLSLEFQDEPHIEVDGVITKLLETFLTIPNHCAPRGYKLVGTLQDSDTIETRLYPPEGYHDDSLLFQDIVAKTTVAYAKEKK